MRVVLRLVARPLKAPRPDSQRARLAAAAAFLAGFVVFGIMYSFGVFVEPMAAAFHVSRAATSAFFSITGLVFYVIGSLTGYLSDRYGPRLVVGTGAIVMGGGLILTAFIGQMWVGYFCYGVGAGVGAACAYVPTLASVGGWFVKRRNTALGIAAAGTGSGMLVVPPLAAALIESFGWRATYVIFGIGSALLLMLCAAAVGPPPITHARVSRPLGRVVRSSEFILLYVSWVLATTALFVPFVFLPAFAHSHGAGKVAASALLSVLGGTSILGRLSIGVLGDWIGTRRLFKVAVFVMGASYLLWLSFPSYGSLVIFAALLGLGYGIRISLMPVVLIDFFGLQKLGTILGIFFTATGVSAALGPVLAGVIVDRTGSYRWGIAFALVAGTLGFVAIVPLKTASQTKR